MLKCECGYTCKRAYNLDRHLTSKKHDANMMEIHMKTCIDPNGNYTCDLCAYSTQFTTNFRKHLLSFKHKQQPTPQEEKPVMLIEVIEMFMKYQSEQVKHQSEQVKHQSIQNTEMFKALAERINVTTASTAATVVVPQNVMMVENNNNSHNKNFNLNFFLNEECKNAMNVSEFIQNVIITSEDLEKIGELGYTAGMSKILSKAIQNQETTERPLHCTDVKRETIYVRKDNTWKKDEDCEETKRLIQHIAHKNYKALNEWSIEHPEHTQSDTEDYEAWYRISRNMCNTDPSALNKLVRHLASMTAVEKQSDLVHHHHP